MDNKHIQQQYEKIIEKRKLNQNCELEVGLLIASCDPTLECILAKYNINKNSPDFEDLKQDGRIAVYKAIDSFILSKNASFLTYASVCAERKIIDGIRRSNNQINQAVNNSLPIDDYENEILSNRKTPEEELIDKERIDIIYSKLNDFQKKVCDLRYREGLSIEETAKALGKNYKSIENAIQQIRKIIKS